jgi:peptidoglycan/xylan/chitin deacetylase (PgdA/CDA1 family)
MCRPPFPGCRSGRHTHAPSGNRRQQISCASLTVRKSADRPRASKGARSPLTVNTTLIQALRNANRRGGTGAGITSSVPKWGMRSLWASILSVLFIALGATASVAGALPAAAPARAQDCPGNPDALGTSRVLVLQPGELMRIGRMQYPETLPLADKEVVLTFDDGPLPPYTNEVLDILASQCVKATYFLVGRMARSFPNVVRLIYEAGHSIGTHSEDHPSRFQKLPVKKVRQEIDQGIADVGAALGDSAELAPFFRIPGLARSNAIEEELASRSLIVFSSDTVADDWYRGIKPNEIVRRAMSRLQARGKGILLLHDIHPKTVAALPVLLKELKEQGFHVVHVIPGERPGRIETAGAPTSATAGSAYRTGAAPPATAGQLPLAGRYLGGVPTVTPIAE